MRPVRIKSGVLRQLSYPFYGYKLLIVLFIKIKKMGTSVPVYI
ncbi:hypothetical protein SALWKB12_1853 [Snodgrassella communis]|uniref:Uncharacterized protein n=1 Tax=Snodgrassella communis TaxID=2946699 RepID=A0A836MRF8_9NEIS|nr:hypothetical protein SALWKB12_1853 [Snodgrassella communis]KDN14795.1 hypothetical protein SALWKB29_1254 [Snodgrassella communis]